MRAQSKLFVGLFLSATLSASALAGTDWEVVALADGKSPANINGIANALWVRNAQGASVQTNLSSGGFKMREASVASGDGEWVYGIGRAGFNDGVVYRWSQATGVQPCPADLDGNDEVGASDLAALLSAWGSFGGSADLDGDGAIGAPDLAALLSAWGACP